jgi:hypothetical protein
MDPTTASHPSVEPNGDASPSPVAAVLEQLLNFSRDDKRFVLRELLRDMLGTKPEGEWCLVNDDRTTFLYLISPGRRTELTVTKERIAQWKAELATAELIPHSEVIAWMEEQLAREQK